MQVILLDFPGIDGEVLLPSPYLNLIAVNSVNIKAASKDPASLSPQAYGDDVKTTGGYGRGDSGDSGASDVASPKAGSKGGGKASVPSSSQSGIDSITLTRSVDAATPKLLSAAFTTSKEPIDATIYIMRTQEQVSDGSATALMSSVMANSVGVSLGALPTVWHKPFLTITLTDAHITGVDITLDKDSMTENLTISFKALDMDYIIYKNGKPQGSVLGSINLANPTKSTESTGL